MKKIILAVALFLTSTYLIANVTVNHSHEKSMDSTVISHSGRTDAYGCHNDRKRGGCHCH